MHPLDSQAARTLARQLYGLDAQVSRLPGYSDQNFLLEAHDRRWVLKIAGATASRDALDLMNRAMEHVALHNASLPVPRLCTTLDGERIAVVEQGEATRYLRLLTYLEGEPWLASGPRCATLHEGLGRCLGAVDRALVDFAHPAMQRTQDWDLAHTLDLQPHVADLPADDRATVERVFDRFARRVEPLWSALRRSVIHSDANGANVLVASGGDDIAGLIDFGDVVHTATVCEVAIAMASVMLERREPLDAASQVLRGYHAVFPLEQVELDVLFDLILARLAGGLVHLHRDRKRDPQNTYIGSIYGPFKQLLDRLVYEESEAVRQRWNEACDPSVIFSGRSKEEILDTRRQHLGASLSIAYQKPLKIVRGAGPYLIDDAGRAFLDSINNVNHIGHCHPRVVAAAAEQNRVLNTNTRYLHDGLAEYTERLAASLPEPLEVCFLTNSGSEANDLALRLARVHTGHHDAVVVDGAYHGTTISVVELSSYKFDGPGGGGLVPHVHMVPTPDVYRGPYKASDPEAGAKYAADVQQQIEAAHSQGRRIAAFFCESMLSCGGQVILPPDYLRGAFRHVRAAGGVCVADEVQVGFGRAGVKFWAFETQDVVPDIVTLGKP
ncbi:MAG: aminotransferase class III-fold pyridoxal phosphate-dependent enzyme, partial [Acidobacteriota bacterium]